MLHIALWLSLLGFPLVDENLHDSGTKEGVGRDEAVMRAVKDTDTEVGVMARSTTRKHNEQGENRKCVMGSSKDRSTSAHSKDNINVRGEPMRGKRRAGRVGTPRCAARKRRNPAISRIYEADKGTATGLAMAFGRTEREGRCEHRTWWFKTIRRRRWTGRGRWFVWTGWACSKWKTKLGKSTTRLRAQLFTLAENLAFFVGKHVPPDGRYREPAYLRTGPDRFRPIGRTHM